MEIYQNCVEIKMYNIGNQQISTFSREESYFVKMPTEGLVTAIELAADERAVRDTGPLNLEIIIEITNFQNIG